MKKVFLLGCFLSFFVSLSFGQKEAITTNDSIILGPKKGFPLTQNGTTLNTKQLTQIFADNPSAKMEFDIAKTNQTFGLILGGAGGFMVGLTLGTAAGGGDANWFVAGAGLACIIGSIPLNSAFRKRTLNAVEIYNEGLVMAHKEDVKADIGFTRDGIGLILKF